MSTSTRTLDRSVHSPDMLRRVDQLLDRFEDAYRAGRTPDLQAFLDEAPEAVRGEVFRELLLLELTHQPPVDAAAAEVSYRQRFPAYQSLIHAVFQGPKTTLAFTGQDAPPPSTTPSAVGAERYELRGELARGGMGIVYEGWDRVLERPVAVKVLTDRAGSGSLATRFVEEARITGQLQHPSIPAVHDLGVLPDGRPFLAMKRIKGETLQTLLQEREQLNVLAVFEGICQAVGYAHAHGVIHRDLKPANVMVGAFGEVQVMDWGLAKVLNQAPTSASEATELDTTAPTEIRTSREADEATRAGSVLGTPAYMPPEQAIGAVDQIDRRSDVFGLGAILCTLLTGKPPYLGADAESTRQLAARAKLEEAKVRLAQCGAEPELVTLCQHCLAPEPNDRPADAGAVAVAVAELRAAAEQRAKQAEVERAQAVVRATEQLKRRRVQVALAGTVALLLLSVGAGVWWQDRQAQERRTETLQRELADEQQRQEERLRASRNSDAVATLVERCEAALRHDDTATASLMLDHARKRLADGGADAFGDRIERCSTDLALLQEFDDVDQFRWTLIEGMYPPKEACAARGLNAFAKFGVVIDQATPRDVLQQFGNSNVRHRIVAALDDLLTNHRWREVRSLLQELDPHPYRDAIRDAVRRLPDHTTLERLMLTEEIFQQPPDFIAAVAEFANRTAIPLKRRREMLHKAIQQRPNHLKLLLFLIEHYPFQQPEWQNERLRWAQAAVAAHPNHTATHVALGEALGKMKDWDGAVASYHEALKIKPADPALHYSLGIILTEKGDKHGAIASYSNAIRIKPSSAQAHNNLGTVLRDIANEGVYNCFREAIRAAAYNCFREAIRLDAKLPQPHNNLAILLHDKGENTAALASYREAIRLDPKNASFHANLGSVLLDLDDVLGAIASCREAILLDPKHVTGHYHLGVAFEKKKDWESALNCYREVLRLDAKYNQAHNQIGSILSEKGDYEAAIASYREAIRLRPQLAAYHYNLGLVLSKQGNRDQAIGCFRDAIDRDPKHANAHDHLGYHILQKGDVDEAIRCYRTLSQLQPKNGKAFIDLGIALGKKNDLVGAIEVFREAIRLNPKSYDAYSRLGLALKAKGNLDEASMCLRKAAQLQPEPDNDRAYFNLGLTLNANGDFDGAITAYQESIRLNPKFVEAHHNLGQGYLRKRDYDNAILCFQAAIRMQPTSPKSALSHTSLGVALREKGDNAGAIASYREAIRLNPNYGEAHNNLGNILMSKGARAEAIDCFRNVVRLDPKNALAFNNIAWMLATGHKEMRDGKQAVQDALKACELTQWQSPVFLDTLGAAYAQVGDFDKASEYAKKALTFPDFEKRHGAEVRQHLELYQQKKALPAPQPRTETPKDKPKEQPKP